MTRSASVVFLPESNVSLTTFLTVYLVTHTCSLQCVVANLEADAEKNTALAEKYGITSYPTIKFFAKVPLFMFEISIWLTISQDNKADPVEYDGERTEESFVDYLNKKCGTHRAVGGGLNEKAGRVEKLDELAAQFVMAARDARDSIYTEALAIAESVGSHAQHYLKIMQKVTNTTDEYFAKESARFDTHRV
jgi:protein disulfide-isomerase A6